jgi:hypothetical protein
MPRQGVTEEGQSNLAFQEFHRQLSHDFLSPTGKRQ